MPFWIHFVKPALGLVQEHTYKSYRHIKIESRTTQSYVCKFAKYNDFVDVSDLLLDQRFTFCSHAEWPFRVKYEAMLFHPDEPPYWSEWVYDRTANDLVLMPVGYIRVLHKIWYKQPYSILD
jgi:hypothetical protein